MRDSRGGGIGLEPVYAANVRLSVNNGTIAAGSVSGTVNGTVGGQPITNGTISNGSLTGGTFTGTVTLTGDSIKTAIDGVDISQAKVGSDTSSLTIGGLATNTQKIIYAAETGTTVDGVVLKDKGITAADGAFTVEGATGNVTTTGDIKGKDITATGALSGASLDVTGNATVGGTLGVTGDATFSGNIKGQSLNIGTNGNEFTVDTDGAVKAAGGKVEIDKTGKATFGENANNRTTIAGKLATFGENGSTDYTTINGGKLDTYDLTVRNDMTVKNFKADNITSTNRITVGEAANEVYLNANGTLSLGVEANQKLGKTQLANINDTIKSGRVIDATSAIIGGVEIKGGNVTTVAGTITGNTITDGNGFTATGGKITAKEGKIGGVVINTAGAVSGVTSLTVNNDINANTFKVNEGNYLDGNGITATGGHIGGAVIDGTTLAVGGTKLDSTEGITTNKLKIADMTLTGTRLNTGANTFEVNGVEFKQGQVTAMADKGFVAGASSFKQGSLIVDDNNKLDATNGLTTKKATVKGTLDVTDKATFGTANKQTTIEGDAITTDTLRANKLILGASGANTVVVDKDGSLKAAGGKFEVDKDGALKAANGAFTVDKDGKTTFTKDTDTKDTDNLSSINGGNIWAKATDAANHTSSELQHDSKGLHVSGTHAGKTSAFAFDAATGISTFTGQDGTTTTINGSAITSTKAAGNTGVLDGSNLTLTNGANKTVMTAGGVTFTGKQGASIKKYNTTTIDGGIITTDTLKVQRIQLGEKIVDERTGQEIGSGVTLASDGGFTAAGGNFKVTGGTTGSKGSIKNVVGDATNGKTAFETNQQGANMSFEKGGIKSEVAVADDSAKISAGASSIEVKNDGITNNGVTTFNGITGTTTKIDGGTITTNHLITDKLTITGSGNADGTGSTTGSIAFGGNGSITSNIKDAATGKEATFKTDEKGTFTEAKDSAGNKTTNTVNAQGNTNEVTDGTNTSTATQTATSIGGVVTNGTVKMKQELTAEGVKVTDELGDPANYTQITNKDVSITDPKNTGERIKLSDLGQLKDLDGELNARSEYTSNETAVGAINAEAAIRREEVARLDGRINDVNDRVNKVGAMAAAIASLKSIGYDPQAPSEFSIGLGQYKGETGVAMGFFHYPNKNFMINVSLSTAGGETMGGIGATWRFGHKSPQKLLEEQREEQAKKELAAAEKYQAAAKLAKEAQERAEYAAKLARQAQVSADNAKAAADATQAKHFG